MDTTHQSSSSVAAEATFLEHLRSVTQPAHRALEKLPLSRSITQETLSYDEYVRYLSSMYNVQHDAEQHIFPLLKTLIPDIESRKKSSKIIDDFTAINASVNTTSVRPISGNLPSASNAFALGIMYVLEGSTLGGRFILKNVQERLGYNAEHGAIYFSGYGDQTGIMWKNFLAMLTQYEKGNAGSSEEIINGANYAFNAIHRHFEEAIS